LKILIALFLASLVAYTDNSSDGFSIRSVYKDAEVTSFRGLKYGGEVLGRLRWHQSKFNAYFLSFNKKKGEGDSACMQPTLISDQDYFFYVPRPRMDEDCLSLNIWAPNGMLNKEPEPLPVMLWIHGGSLLDGSGSMPIYDGSELAKKGVIVVTINYRLNVFGYFSHPELSAESPHGASGNYGTLDQIQALRWVQKNIAQFGGDPDNVTIFGESAGAYSVVQLLLSPLSKGLFHKAIAQSPYIKPLPGLKTSQFGKPAAEQMGVQFAKSLGVETLAELRALPAETLIKAVEEIEDVYVRIPSPVVDNYVITDQLFHLIEQGKQHDVPLLMGFNSHEGFHMSLYAKWKESLPASPEDYIGKVQVRYGDLTDEYLNIYPATELDASIFGPYRDGFFGWATQKYIRSAAKHNSSKAYLYYYDHDWAGDTNLSAFHASELPFVFNNVKHGAKYSDNWPDLKPTQNDLTMAEVMSDYWVAFAKHGKPAVKGLPEWKPYTNSKKDYIRFKEGEAIPEQDLLPGSYELHEKIIGRRREKGDQPWGLSNIGLLAPVLPEYQSGPAKEQAAQ